MHPGVFTIIMLCVDVLLIVGVLIEGLVEPRKGNKILAGAFVVTFLAMLLDTSLYS
ncbi:hypothetical protein [Carnimonas nigrificans]|uniref:hypothetical protein n=1 Tax=Carnimonas nigrificans TaxID=64323 RepID=UPI0004B188C9|nr:hypothetical protein [Carnimonas nigrificans]